MAYDDEQLIHDFNEVCDILRSQKHGNPKISGVIDGYMVRKSVPVTVLTRNHGDLIHENFMYGLTSETMEENKMPERWLEQLSLRNYNNIEEPITIGTISHRKGDGTVEKNIFLETLTSETKKQFILAAHSILTPEIDTRLAQRLATNIQNRQLREEQISAFTNG